MWYVRTAREIATIAKDLYWLAEMAKDALCTPAREPPEIELIEQFRECTPPVHEEPVWGTEAEEFDTGWCVVRPAS